MTAAVSTRLQNALNRALAICPSREEFARLYGDGSQKRGNQRAVMAVFPGLTKADVERLAYYWGLMHGYKGGRQLTLVAPEVPTIEPESFEALAQRLAVRVSEILLEKWLK